MRNAQFSPCNALICLNRTGSRNACSSYSAWDAAKSNPMNRIGEAAEQARAILFPAASYINGALLPVDGGALF